VSRLLQQPRHVRAEDVHGGHPLLVGLHLTRRGTDAEDVIAKRLKNALGELKEAAHFDYLIINDDLEEATDELRAVYVAGRARAVCRPGLLPGLLAQWESA